MCLRKIMFFKTVSILVIVLFTCQCMVYQKGKLISTRKLVDDTRIWGYIYKIEAIKSPSLQDLTVEYRIIKYPMEKVSFINTYERTKKYSQFTTSILGAIAGGIIGVMASFGAEEGMPSNVLNTPGLYLAGGILIPLAFKENKKVIGQVVAPGETYLSMKPNSTPIPAQNLPTEIRWTSGRNVKLFKTRTNELGFLKINLVDDLKMKEVPPDRSIQLFIDFINAEGQERETFRDTQFITDTATSHGGRIAEETGDR